MPPRGRRESQTADGKNLLQFSVVSFEDRTASGEGDPSTSAEETVLYSKDDKIYFRPKSDGTVEELAGSVSPSTTGVFTHTDDTGQTYVMSDGGGTRAGFLVTGSVNNTHIRLIETAAVEVQIAAGSANGTFGTVTVHPLAIHAGNITLLRLTPTTGVTDSVFASLGTLEATSPTVAANTYAGGVGIAKALWVGGLANVAGAMTMQAAATIGGTLGVTGVATFSNASVVQVNDGGSAFFTSTTYRTSTAGGGHIIQQARGSEATPTIVSASDAIGRLIFKGYDGAAFQTAAEIHAIVDATPGAGDMPGGLIFKVTPDGSTTAATALTIRNDGRVILADDTASSSSTTGALVVSGGAGIAKSTHIASADALAVPVLALDQNDISEEFIDFQTPATTAGNPAELGAGTTSTKDGDIRISINGTFHYIRTYDAAG